MEVFVENWYFNWSRIYKILEGSAKVRTPDVRIPQNFQKNYRIIFF
jgi:hypothetical protein